MNYGSIIRSGTTAAVIAGLLFLLSLTPFFNHLILVLVLLGVIFIPMGAGIGYGYLAPGEETMRQSTVGGALSGLVAGVVLGIAFGANAFMLDATSTGLLGYAIVNSVEVVIIASIIFGLFAAIMGAIGGAIWQIFQP